jgi:hypothetical protein
VSLRGSDRDLGHAGIVDGDAKEAGKKTERETNSATPIGGDRSPVGQLRARQAFVLPMTDDR